MGYDNLPVQPPLFPAEAEDYAQQALESSRAAASLCRATYDIAYGDHSSQRLDIYRPNSLGDEPLPVLMFAHGGAWTNGYKEWMGLLAPAITAAPAILVTVSYRLAPEFQYPDPFTDCVRALKWVNRNIGAYGGDPHSVLVGGHSSGGTLFSLVALRRDVLRQAGLPEDAIAGCVPLSARFDMAFYNPEPGSAEERHKALVFRDGANMSTFSPLHNIAGNRTPFLIANGSKDIPALRTQADAMVNALREQGSHVEHLVLDGYDHFETALRMGDMDDPWSTAVRDRLRCVQSATSATKSQQESSTIEGRNSNVH